MNNLHTVMNYLSKKDNLSDIKEIIARRKAVSQAEYDEVFSNQRFIDVLINDYKEWGTLIVAFDFDDTIKPSDKGKPCDLVIELLQVCSKLGFTMICFTARTLEKDIEMVKQTCEELHIRCDYINEDCDSVKKNKTFEHATKIFYNVFLDDRAGLRQSYEVLWGFIDWFLSQNPDSIDAREGGY